MLICCDEFLTALYMIYCLDSDAIHVLAKISIFCEKYIAGLGPGEIAAIAVACVVFVLIVVLLSMVGRYYIKRRAYRAMEEEGMKIMSQDTYANCPLYFSNIGY